MTDTNPTVTEAEALEALDRMKNAVTNTLVIPRHSYHRLHAFILSFTNVERERDELRARNANLYATQGEELARIGVAREAEQAELRSLRAKVETLTGALKPFADFLDKINRPDLPDNRSCFHADSQNYVTMGDLRAAKKALESSQ